MQVPTLFPKYNQHQKKAQQIDSPTILYMQIYMRLHASACIYVYTSACSGACIGKRMVAFTTECNFYAIEKNTCSYTCAHMQKYRYACIYALIHASVCTAVCNEVQLNQAIVLIYQKYEKIMEIQTRFFLFFCIFLNPISVKFS